MNMEVRKDKKNTLIMVSLLAVIVSLLFVVYFLFAKVKKNQFKDNDIVASSKHGTVSVGEIKKYLVSLENSFSQNFDFNRLSNEEKELLVKEIINERIILEKAKKDNIVSSKEYKDRIITIESNLMREIFLRKMVDKVITEDMVKEKYEEVKQQLLGKKETKVKHILVKTEEEIKNVVKELGGMSFEDVAQKYSIDASRDNGGDLGYIIEDQVVPEFAEAMKKVQFNKLSEPFKTQFGWHVLIKEKQKKARVPEYEESKNVIKNNLMKEYLRKYREENLKDSDIKFIK